MPTLGGGFRPGDLVQFKKFKTLAWARAPSDHWARTSHPFDDWPTYADDLAGPFVFITYLKHRLASPTAWVLLIIDDGRLGYVSSNRLVAA